VSLWATLMAVAAHVAASGEPPSVVALVPVVAAGAGLAWWAAARRIGFGTALALLAAPQAAVHALSGYVHGHAVLPSGGMLLAHLVGLVLVAVGIATAERLWWAWSQRVAFVLSLVCVPQRLVTARPVSRSSAPVPSPLLHHVLVRRGPPRSWFVAVPVARARG